MMDYLHRFVLTKKPKHFQIFNDMKYLSKVWAEKNNNLGFGLVANRRSIQTCTNELNYVWLIKTHTVLKNRIVGCSALYSKVFFLESGTGCVRGMGVAQGWQG